MNRLNESQPAGGNLERYEYDGHGRRTATFRSNGTVKIDYYTRDGVLRATADTGMGGSGGSAIYVHLGDVLVAQDAWAWRSPFGMTYFHVDHQGTPIARSDAWGVVFERTRRESFGLPLTGPLKNGPGYTGHMEDPGTGLVYMQQRYYDPAIGRFLSVDPVGPLADPTNHFGRYHYAHNTPYRFVDPDGRAACPKGSGGTCIDSPRTETGTTVQAGPSAQQQAVDGQVRSASRSGSLSDGTKLDFKGNEQGFKASAEGTSSNPMETSCQACSDGSTREVGSYNLRALGPGESGGHTHTNRTSGLPGPEDGRMADATGRTAYVISPRGAYAIEKTDVGYRVRVLDGRRLDSSERRAVRGTIDAWNKNQGGSGVSKCVPTRC